MSTTDLPEKGVTLPASIPAAEPSPALTKAATPSALVREEVASTLETTAQELIALYKEKKDWGDPEVNALLVQWLKQQELRIVESGESDLTVPRIQFNIQLARLYLEAGDIYSAFTSFRDARILAFFSANYDIQDEIKAEMSWIKESLRIKFTNFIKLNEELDPDELIEILTVFHGVNTGKVTEVFPNLSGFEKGKVIFKEDTQKREQCIVMEGIDEKKEVKWSQSINSHTGQIYDENELVDWN